MQIAFQLVVAKGNVAMMMLIKWSEEGKLFSDWTRLTLLLETKAKIKIQAEKIAQIICSSFIVLLSPARN